MFCVTVFYTYTNFVSSGSSAERPKERRLTANIIIWARDICPELSGKQWVDYSQLTQNSLQKPERCVVYGIQLHLFNTPPGILLPYDTYFVTVNKAQHASLSSCNSSVIACLNLNCSYLVRSLYTVFVHWFIKLSTTLFLAKGSLVDSGTFCTRHMFSLLS